MTDPVIILIAFAGTALLFLRVLVSLQERRRRKKWEADMRRAFRETDFEEWWSRR